MSKMSNEEILKAIEDILKQRDTDNYVELSTLKPGETFMDGRFVVLDSWKDVAYVRDMEDRTNRIFDKNSSDWKDSDLRKYLNTDVLAEYEKLFGAGSIAETVTDLTTVDGQNTYCTCTDKVRLLTFAEYRKYQELYEKSGKWEWTVTPWSTKERGIDYSVCVVSPWGRVSNINCDNYSAVRPFVSLKSNIFVSR